jgi:hypothetical protein
MTEALLYQRCAACGHVQGLPRPFCAGCGRPAPARLRSAGLGRVRAVTTLHRAPTPEWQARVPYTVALVMLDEGFTRMAQVGAQTRIGDRMRAAPGGDTPLLRFVMETPA